MNKHTFSNPLVTEKGDKVIITVTHKKPAYTSTFEDMIPHETLECMTLDDIAMAITIKVNQAYDKQGAHSDIYRKLHVVSETMRLITE